jgi:uncharacterized membrane protein YkvA (DUF1232 family)
VNENDHSKEYSEESLWAKIKQFAQIAGKELIEKVLILWHTLKDKDTPAWAKGTIVAALGYFIAPLDMIPDIVPAAGYSDDLGALALALVAVAAHIKESHRQKAKEMLKRWFPEK